MVTMDILPEGAIHIESIEEALACMEQSIQQKIRKVDICTRYSAMQYLIVLFEPDESQIPMVMDLSLIHIWCLEIGRLQFTEKGILKMCCVV